MVSMPPKNSKPSGQHPAKGPQNNTANIAMEKASKNANEGEGEATDNVPSNSVILDANHSLKEEFAKQSNEMLDAINGIKTDVLSHSRRIGETEERISQAEDVTSLQQKVEQLEGTVEILRNKIQDQAPRPIVMKFPNYEDREKTLRTARKQKEVRYRNQRNQRNKLKPASVRRIRPS